MLQLEMMEVGGPGILPGLALPPTVAVSRLWLPPPQPALHTHSQTAAISPAPKDSGRDRKNKDNLFSQSFPPAEEL